MTVFIDDHKDRFGVEPICRTLTAHGVPIAPSTYYAAKTRPPSPRQVRDVALSVEIVRVFSARDLGRGLAGVRKVWRLLRRDPSIADRFGPVARCTVARLMTQAGLKGVRRGLFLCKLFLEASHSIYFIAIRTFRVTAYRYQLLSH